MSEQFVHDAIIADKRLDWTIVYCRTILFWKIPIGSIRNMMSKWTDRISIFWPSFDHLSVFFFYLLDCAEARAYLKGEQYAYSINARVSVLLLLNSCIRLYWYWPLDFLFFFFKSTRFVWREECKHWTYTIRFIEMTTKSTDDDYLEKKILPKEYSK